jgi:hypothetical protein
MTHPERLYQKSRSTVRDIEYRVIHQGMHSSVACLAVAKKKGLKLDYVTAMWEAHVDRHEDRLWGK